MVSLVVFREGASGVSGGSGASDGDASHPRGGDRGRHCGERIALFMMSFANCCREGSQTNGSASVPVWSVSLNFLRCRLHFFAAECQTPSPTRPLSESNNQPTKWKHLKQRERSVDREGREVDGAPWLDPPHHFPAGGSIDRAPKPTQELPWSHWKGWGATSRGGGQVGGVTYGHV